MSTLSTLHIILQEITEKQAEYRAKWVQASGEQEEAIYAQRINGLEDAEFILLKYIDRLEAMYD